MKTLKNITTAIPFFKSLISNTTKKETTKARFRKLGGKSKNTSNAALSQMYSKENEILFI